MDIQARMNRRTESLTDQFGGILRCETCGRSEPVEARYWSVGWPKCHGYTMRWWTERQFRAGEVPPVR